MLFTEHPFLDRFERRASRLRRRSSSCSPRHTPGERGAAEGQQACSACCTTCRPATGRPASAASPACPTASTNSAPRRRGHRVRAPRSARRQLNCLAGKAPLGDRSDDAAPDLRRQPALYAAAELKKARPQAADRADQHLRHPGFFLHRTAQAIAIMDEVGAGQPLPAVRHLPRAAQEGELAATMAKHPRIAHVQIADNPGRNEPRHGRDQLRLPVPATSPHRLPGWIGCEYKPGDQHRGRPLAGWLNARRRREPNSIPNETTT